MESGEWAVKSDGWRVTSEMTVMVNAYNENKSRLAGGRIVV